MTENEPRTQTKPRSPPGPANDVWALAGQLLNKERNVISALLCLLIALTVYDFFEDRAEGASLEALFSDVSDVFLPVILLLYIWRYKPLEMLKRTDKLKQDLVQTHADLEQWRSKASEYIKGLSDTINQQLEQWQLSVAEKEVALLLLKGLSLKELALVRGVSERTVRQQATRVYEKGRAELSAFFLEDLMSPVE